VCVGHGGDGFLKFQDAEEISKQELGDAFEQMWQKRRCYTTSVGVNIAENVTCLTVLIIVRALQNAV